jgi:hypothetical protein
MSVGWNLFKALSHAANSAVRSFAHIAHDLAGPATAAATVLGLPAVAGAGLVELLMKTHAKNPAAHQKLGEVMSRGEPWPTLVKQIAAQLKAHPDWKSFSEHAKATGKAVRGIMGEGDWWDPVEGMARPAPPTGGGMSRAQLMATLRQRAQAPSAPSPADAAAMSDGGVPGDGGDTSEPDDSF